MGTFYKIKPIRKPQRSLRKSFGDQSTKILRKNKTDFRNFSTAESTLESSIAIDYVDPLTIIEEKFKESLYK